MDNHSLRALEMGLGVMLFAMGLALFLRMNHETLTFMDRGQEAAETYSQHQVVTGSADTAAYSREAIYMLLTDESMQPEANVLGGVSYGTSSIQVYIDSVLYTAVSDYGDRQSLVSALSGLSATEYDVSYVVDDDLKLTEIHFTGR